MEIAISIGKKYERNQQHLSYVIGKMNNSLVSARTQWKAMVAHTNNIDFKRNLMVTLDIVALKTNVANACIQTVQEAMDSIGGKSFYRKNTLERIFRDVQAAPFHPIPTWEQYPVAGQRLLDSV